MPFLHLFEELLGPYSSFAFLAQAALTIWMLVDLNRRGGEQVWFWIILFFQPFGAWAYFFAIKLPTLRWFQRSTGSGLASLFQRRVTLAELQYKAEHISTLANRVALATRLIELKRFDEAVPHLEAARKTEPDHCQILYSLALCHVRLHRPDLGIPHLEHLLQRDARWSNYLGWQLLIEARDDKGDLEGALAACREMVRLAPTLQHQCTLAEHLFAQKNADEARRLLERALGDHSFAPGPIRSRNRRWAAEARRLLKNGSPQ